LPISTSSSSSFFSSSFGFSSATLAAGPAPAAGAFLAASRIALA